jgi:hypothetical protein
LAAGEEESLEVTVTIPYDAPLSTVDVITCQATSRGNPSFEDDDYLAVTVSAVRGDANNDGTIDVGDVVYLVSYLYKAGPAPEIIESGDCNCDGPIDVGDVVYLVNYLFRGGPLPCAP